MSKPLGFYITRFPEPGIEYQASYPKTFLEKIRLGAAKTFIKVGYRLLLNNGTVRITSGAGGRARKRRRR